MKIQVTAEHIKHGIKHNGTACPVYRAMRDAGVLVNFVAPLSGYTFESPELVEEARKGEIFWSELKLHKFPKAVQDWIVYFDTRDSDEPEAEPIEFEIPDEFPA